MEPQSVGPQETLRDELVRFVRRKFSSHTHIAECADDIVNEAMLAVWRKAEGSPDKANFGYLSVACLRVAFKYFKARDAESVRVNVGSETLEVLSEDDFVADLMRHEDTSAVLASLEILKKVERVIVMQRYYGDVTFAQIAAQNGIKLNTVLSHHRRALEKLRPVLSRQFNFDEHW
jgi:RNA polymerase sigma-70 factor (ECF subfamily)